MLEISHNYSHDTVKVLVVEMDQTGYRQNLSRYPVKFGESLLLASVARNDVTELTCVWRNSAELRQEYQQQPIHLSGPKSVDRWIPSRRHSLPPFEHLKYNLPLRCHPLCPQGHSNDSAIY